MGGLSTWGRNHFCCELESLYTPYISISASQRPLLDRFPSQTLIVPTTSFEHADQHDQSFFTRTRFHSTTSIKMQLIASVAALAATITSVNALGNAIVNNNCNFPVYLWPIDAQRNPSDPTIIAPGGSYSEPYHTPSSGGVSLKLSRQNNKGGPVTQFEYTVQSYAANPFLWYDGSHVDCVDDACPFWDYGINLKASDASCPTRDCAVGKVCSGFYTLWNDDINTLSCGDEANVIMTVCSVNQGGDSSPVQKQAVPASTKAAIINEAVATTFATQYAAPSKRAEPVRHGHMHFHQRSNQQ